MFQSTKTSLIIFLMGGLLASCATPAVTVAPTIEPSDSERKLTVDGTERSYLLHIPPGLDSLHPVPVVFAFHGWGDQPTDMQASTGLDEIANSNAFLVVYPKGIELSWNAGGTCCGAAEARGIDESAFIRQILLDIRGSFSVDNKRIYAIGFSNGAGLVYRLACEMSDTFAAVAPVAGALTFDPCTPQGPVSIIHMHGLKDDWAPYEGGGAYNILPIEKMLSNLAKLDGCTDEAQTDTSKKFIKHVTYSVCNAGVSVELYAIEIGYHGWPSDVVLPASQVIWDFFAAHPKP